MLCATLAVTPLRRLTGRSELARIRRMLGLFTFFYACLHLGTYVWLDQWFDVAAIARDILKRPFITVGISAFALLVPLAVTSTNAMMRRLGRRWAELHRLVYAIGPLAILHYWWHKAGKNDLLEPAIYGLVIAALLGARLLRRRRSAQAGSGSAQAGSGSAQAGSGSAQAGRGSAQAERGSAPAGWGSS